MRATQPELAMRVADHEEHGTTRQHSMATPGRGSYLRLLAMAVASERLCNVVGGMTPVSVRRLDHQIVRVRRGRRRLVAAMHRGAHP